MVVLSVVVVSEGVVTSCIPLLPVEPAVNITSSWYVTHDGAAAIWSSRACCACRPLGAVVAV